MASGDGDDDAALCMMIMTMMQRVVVMALNESVTRYESVELVVFVRVDLRNWSGVVGGGVDVLFTLCCTN